MQETAHLLSVILPRQPEEYHTVLAVPLIHGRLDISPDKAAKQNKMH